MVFDHKITMVYKSLLFNPKEVECPERGQALLGGVEGQYFVYLLFCKDESFYCGSTANLQNRLKEHNNGEGAIWTKKRLPVKLVYYESHGSVASARRREKQIKGWTREKKIKLIVGIWGR